MKLITFDEYRKMNEELNYDITPCEYTIVHQDIIKTIYEFTISENIIKVEFKRNMKFKTENGIYERSYTINNTMSIKQKVNIFKLMGNISYITTEFIKEYNPSLIVINHISIGDKTSINSRAEINKPYLSNIATKTNYIFKQHKPENDNINKVYSFLSTHENLINKFLSK